MKIDLESLGDVLAERLDRSHLNTQHLLGRCRLIDEGSRDTPAFTDPRYLPFYYHLGEAVPATSLVEIGFRLGLPSACFLQGCRGVEAFFGFREDQGEFYSPRLAVGNVKDHFRGKIATAHGATTDPAFLDNLGGRRWDVVLIDEETEYDKHRTYLDLAWAALASGGLLVVDYLNRHEPSRRAFREFCATHGRPPAVLPTRYGVGIIQR